MRRAGLLCLLFLSGCGATTHAPATATAPVSTNASPAPETTLTAPQSAVAQVAKTSSETNLRGDDTGPTGPAALGPQSLGPAVSGGVAGCRPRFISSYSSRNGSRILIIVLHYTVSPNEPGFRDVDSVTIFFSHASTQASSNFVDDTDGNCNYIVPLSGKAWAQAGANSFSVSVEQIDTGNESVYAQRGGLLRLAKIIYYVHKTYGVPIRAGLVRNCQPVRSGIVDHKSLGTCGGGHVDIGKFSPAAVIRFAQRYAASQDCNKACRQRRAHVALTKRLRDEHTSILTAYKKGHCRQSKRPACVKLRAANATLHVKAKRNHVKL